MNGKLIITKANWLKTKKNLTPKIFSGFISDKGFYQVGFSNEISTSDIKTTRVGDIIVGRVRDIVKNINAAFVEIQPGYTGYYSLDENTSHVFLNLKNTTKLCQGDLILVQIYKAAVKNKAPVLTSKISLPGQYIVMNIHGKGIGFSNKIKNKETKEHMIELVNQYINAKEYGIVIRTNALMAKDNDIITEIDRLMNEWNQILSDAMHRPCFYVVKQAEPEYLSLIKGSYINEIDIIVTDCHNIYEEVVQYLNLMSLSNIKPVFYEDDLLPLYKFYELETLTKKIISKNVWLKSGAYLVIEPTEAMVVVDVNTGKCIKGKKPEETILYVNLEAAKEIASQIRLRNLSGIIIIDFINMDLEENKVKLIEELKYYIAMDKIKTNFVEMTKLNLVLLTRKKIDAPIYEQIENEE